MWAYVSLMDTMIKIKSLQFAKDSRDIVNLYSIFYSCARNADKFACNLFIFYITHIFTHTNINIPFPYYFLSDGTVDLSHIM